VIGVLEFKRSESELRPIQAQGIAYISNLCANPVYSKTQPGRALGVFFSQIGTTVKAMVSWFVPYESEPSTSPAAPAASSSSSSASTSSAAESFFKYMPFNLFEIPIEASVTSPHELSRLLAALAYTFLSYDQSQPVTESINWQQVPAKGMRWVCSIQQNTVVKVLKKNRDPNRLKFAIEQMEEHLGAKVTCENDKFVIVVYKMKEGKCAPETLYLEQLIDTATKLQSLHSANIVHGDVRLYNLVFSNDGKTAHWIDFDECAHLSGDTPVPYERWLLPVCDRILHPDFADPSQNLPSMCIRHDIYHFVSLLTFYQPIQSADALNWNFKRGNLEQWTSMDQIIEKLRTCNSNELKLISSSPFSSSKQATQSPEKRQQPTPPPRTL
jgi:serine/threonine protein kinase